MANSDAIEWTPIFQEKAAEYTQDNWTLRFNNRIVPDHPKSGWKQYVKNTCGWYRCRKCRRTWPSNRVTVFFHMRLNRRTHQGIIYVRRFRQNCKTCRNAPMEIPDIEYDNIEILMDSLLKNIRRKFYHEDFGGAERPHIGVNVRNPHEPLHCEACIAGVCQRDLEAIDIAMQRFRL